MKSTVIWITGLSGAGKTTLAYSLQKKLENNNINSVVIDGDELRKERPNLGFSKQDRLSNSYHAAYKVIAFLEANLESVSIVSLVSPYKEHRDEIREIISKRYYKYEFVEVFLNTPLIVCEQRDAKGLYKKARNGEIKEFTGIDSLYEPPTDHEIEITEMSVEDSVDYVLNYLATS